MTFWMVLVICWLSVTPSTKQLVKDQSLSSNIAINGFMRHLLVVDLSSFRVEMGDVMV